MNLTQFLKFLFRIVVGIILVNALSKSNYFDYIFHPILFFLFLFPEKIFKVFKISNPKNDDFNYLSLFSEKDSYQMMISIGLILVLVLCTDIILDSFFPPYLESSDFLLDLESNYSKESNVQQGYFNFKEASKSLSIITFTYLPLIVFSEKISNYLSNSNQSGEIIMFFRILFRLSFLYILIYHIYEPLIVVFDYSIATTPYIKSQTANKLLFYLPIFITVSFFLLFKPNLLIKLLGIDKLQNHINMNNINILQERIIYRIAILTASFYVLFRYITFFKAAVVENYSIGMRPIWAKYDFWSALIIVIFFVGVIRYNKKIVEFLIKN